ncbi:ferredoxin [Nocardioides sp. WS12]|uniref:ferredoxin n=1 Tax=Nocardioides sp. WS12 TaxID=2486272 RepID=UPI0015F95C17|nr:ferredoxin [Nocardioides sp. WS12]
MNVSVEAHKCVSSGQCVLIAPEVFDQDDEGLVLLLEETPGADEHENVKEAAAVCPAAAIHLRQD